VPCEALGAQGEARSALSMETSGSSTSNQRKHRQHDKAGEHRVDVEHAFARDHGKSDTVGVTVSYPKQCG
jgi:hypothetical protein